MFYADISLLGRILMSELKSFHYFWEQKYLDGYDTRYPWDTVVSFVFRNAPENKPRQEVKILEVGCGTGANLWFAAREGFRVYGVDGSATAIDLAKKRFHDDELNGNFYVADFTCLPFDDTEFDLVIDRAALTCVGFAAAQKAIKEIYRVMKLGARFFFCPYSDRHSSCSSGEQGQDEQRMNITLGTMVDAGPICFYGRQQVIKILQDFHLSSLQHMEYAEMLEPAWLVHAEWRVIASKTKNDY